jgi:soluble lytic murein transglycosylase-like protein
MKISLRTVVFAFLCLFGAAISGQAQEAAKPVTTALASQLAAKPASLPAANKIGDSKAGLIKATEEYKSSLGGVLTFYESNVKQLEDKAAQLKGLYDDGLISKREFEAAQAAVTEARSKVDGTRKQLTDADSAITDARRAPQKLIFPGTTPGGETSWTTGNSRYDALIRSSGAEFGVDPYLIYCVMEQESRFNATAVSPVGAQGLMQLMPATAARFGVVSAFDPVQNIKGGTRYLKTLLQMFDGRVDLTLASYNAGEGAVFKYGGKVPPYKETQAYVRAISTRYGQSPKKR